MRLENVKPQEEVDFGRRAADRQEGKEGESGMRRAILMILVLKRARVSSPPCDSLFAVEYYLACSPGLLRWFACLIMWTNMIPQANAAQLPDRILLKS